MAIKDAASTARVLFDCLIREKPDFARISHTPSKTELLSPDDDEFFPNATPEEVGLDGERLLAFLREASACKTADVHSIVVLSHGKCVFEAAKAGYATNMPHATFSLCKTLTGLAIGILVDDGKLQLSTPVMQFFPEYKEKLAKGKFARLRVSHLLEMSTGNSFNEAGVISSESYTRSYFESALLGEPGREFSYNSMNSYILSIILHRVSGYSLSEFLTERVFTPLGISSHFWEKTTEGVEKGGWGLYLTPRSMAKLGELFVRDGVWQGKRIISSEYLKTMTAPHMPVPVTTGAFDYGYHVWRHKRNGSLLLNGMLGQNTWVLPEEELVVTITAGDCCLFQDSPPLLSAMRHLKPPFQPRDTEEAKAARAHLAQHFGEDGSFTPPYVSDESREGEALLLPELLDRFAVSKNNSGILPLVTRLIQNNPTPGISFITVERGEEGALIFSFEEGNALHRIPAANTRFLPSVQDIHGEPYRIMAAYSFGMDELRYPYLRLELRYPALANSRRMIFSLTEEGLTVRVSEQPGYPLVEKLIRILPKDGADFIQSVRKQAKSSSDWALSAVKRAFSPTLSLNVTFDSGARKQIDREDGISPAPITK